MEHTPGSLVLEACITVGLIGQKALNKVFCQKNTSIFV
jgi:hypothetical protein